HRHGRACPGHPRVCRPAKNTWTPGTSPGVTIEGRARSSVLSPSRAPTYNPRDHPGERSVAAMLETTVAGSLPKPAWLAKPKMLWAPWVPEGADALAQAKADATLLALKMQEDAGIDIVSDGEMSRVHFVHGFLAEIDGIDHARQVTMGIRNNRYEAQVPTVTGALRRRRSVHATEAALARAHTTRRLKFTLPGPMTIVDTVADGHYGDRVKMAFAF